MHRTSSRIDVEREGVALIMGQRSMSEQEVLDRVVCSPLKGACFILLRVGNGVVRRRILDDEALGEVVERVGATGIHMVARQRPGECSTAFVRPRAQQRGRTERTE